MPRKLKVFRTPIGFHDAYVAAPSQKAALEAWGADVDLFARGAADLVEDDRLTREPLAHPGQVIKRARGSADEHLAALAAQEKPTPKSRSKRAPTTATPTPTAKRAAKPKPRPSRARLDQAEAAIAAAEARHDCAEQALRDREKQIDRERRALHKAQAAERAKLERAIDHAKTSYDAAMRRWRDA